jgi:hypothetical protein
MKIKNMVIVRSNTIEYYSMNCRTQYATDIYSLYRLTLITCFPELSANETPSY